MLRTTVIAVAGLGLAATVGLAVLGATSAVGVPVAAMLWVAVQLFIVIAAIAFERVRYKRFDRMAPPGFVGTLERFVDPSTGVAVQVWFNPATGERRYVATGPV